MSNDTRAAIDYPYTEDRIDYAEQQARAAGLTGEQVASMQARMLGATLTHFDEDPIVPMTDARWRRIVRVAITEASA